MGYRSALENVFNRKSFEVYESHSWVIDKVSPELEVLAVSDHGMASIKHVDKPIYGLQFHPENLVNQTYGDEIFINLIKLFIKD